MVPYIMCDYVYKNFKEKKILFKSVIPLQPIILIYEYVTQIYIGNKTLVTWCK